MRQFVVLTRHGQPFLYLPRQRAQALQAITLYPAQRTAARLARSLIRRACTLGLTRLLPSIGLAMPADAPLSAFLRRVSGESRVPDLAVLAGNPNAPGRRYILLLFDAADRPSAVVKVGISQRAMELVEREAAVLESVPKEALGLPPLRASHRGPGLRALALDYVEGDAPAPGTSQPLARVLSSWIHASRLLPVSAIPSWQELVQACPPHPLFNAIHRRIESTNLHPALHHGDFAPWNIKVTRDGTWVVLDWERGEATGMPAWDWFHYHLQVGLLVNRLPTPRHADHVDRWLADPALVQYAGQAGATHLLRDLLLAYLLYSIEVIRPTEGLPATRDLLDALAQRWNVA